MEDGGFGSTDELLWSPDGDDTFDLGSDLFTDPEGASIPGLMETEGYVPSYLVGGGGNDYASFTGSEWKAEPLGGGGDTGIGETLEYNVGGAIGGSLGGGDTGDGYNSTGGGGDVPVNFGSGEAGGAFASIGSGAASLWKSIGSLVNPISTAIIGKPLIKTTATGAAATAAQQAAAQKAQMQNLLVVGALGVGAYLIFKKK